MRILFYYFLVGTLVTMPLAMAHHLSFALKDYLLLCGVGFSTYLAQKFLTISLQYANATTLAPICYISILFTGLFGWLFWHEIPQKMTLLGMTLVICGCLLSIIVSRKNGRNKSLFLIRAPQMD